MERLDQLHMIFVGFNGKQDRMLLEETSKNDMIWCERRFNCSSWLWHLGVFCKGIYRDNKCFVSTDGYQCLTCGSECHQWFYGLQWNDLSLGESSRAKNPSYNTTKAFRQLYSKCGNISEVNYLICVSRTNIALFNVLFLNSSEPTLYIKTKDAVHYQNHGKIRVFLRFRFRCCSNEVMDDWQIAYRDKIGLKPDDLHLDKRSRKSGIRINFLSF